MLGRRIDDRSSAAPAWSRASGWLPAETHFEAGKVTRPAPAGGGARRRMPASSRHPVTGYQIHHGRTTSDAPWITLDDAVGTPAEGAADADGRSSARASTACSRPTPSGRPSSPPSPTGEARPTPPRASRSPPPGTPSSTARRPASRPTSTWPPSSDLIAEPTAVTSVILFLTNADTEILALRAAIEMLPEGLPAGAGRITGRLWTTAAGPRRRRRRPRPAPRRAAGVGGAVRRRCAAACAERGVALLAFGGEAAPRRRAHRRCRPSRRRHRRRLPVPRSTAARPTRPTCCGSWPTRCSAPPLPTATPRRSPSPTRASTGRPRTDPDFDPARPTVGVVFYRAHLLAGNTTFVDDLCAALRERGANALACWCYSLRPDERGDVPVISRYLEGRVDAVVTTVLAMGQAGPDDRLWDVPVLARLDVPVVQAVAATTSRAAWEDNDVGLSPLDTAWSVALPEFDGRIVSVPLSFKEIVDDGDDLGVPVVAYRTVPDRVARVAGTGRPAGRAAAQTQRRQADRHRPVGLPDEAGPDRQRRRPRHAGLGHRAAPRPAGRRLPGRRHPRRRRHPHGRADRPVLLREGVPHHRPARTGRRRSERRRLRRLVRRTPETVAGQRRRALGRTARHGLPPRRRHPPGRPRPRSRAGHGPAAPGLRREPDRRLPLPRPAADPPLPGLLPVAGTVVGRRRRRPRRQARQPRMAARQGRRPVGRLRPRRRPRRPAAGLPLRRQRSRRGHAGQAPGPRGDHRPPRAADDPGRGLRRPGPARAAARRVLPGVDPRPGQAARPAGPDLGAAASGPPSTTTSTGPAPPPATTTSTTSSSTSTATSAN